MSAASPMSSSGDQVQGSSQIHFRFCRECSNLLYPKEDRNTNTLMFTCRTCHVGEPASSPCLPRSNKLCPSCGENEAVFFQSQQRSAETGMKLYYVCCTCGNVFT
ncbi:DNA directed RNA polymerase II 15 kDa subunit [Histoplasma capsulatum]|uniref:DNA-directed RNA polymerase II subunit RPB9 n=1 Tax=Ajellomyces capsulatus TaxID=5037 RepID=A0A8A1MDE2_AJECA|nr:predicted protein [Histoplasma mississippiense (nom. inval.)]EDN10899.1 predicted protein [Histoplasma mississippiense (nom. inval.)]QSS63959.1 DNA directed RNA polymerase II 15 kDa subunit [Histoplasma capsulatum]